jgi:hypothetical protein
MNMFNLMRLDEEIRDLSPLGQKMKPFDVNQYLSCKAHDTINCNQCQVLRFDCAHFVHTKGRYANQNKMFPESPVVCYDWTYPGQSCNCGFGQCIRGTCLSWCCCCPGVTDIYNPVQQVHYCLTDAHKKLFKDAAYKQARQVGMAPLEEIVVAACNACNEVVAQSPVTSSVVVCCSGKNDVVAQLDMLRESISAVPTTSTKLTDAFSDQGGLSLRIFDKQDASSLDNTGMAKVMFKGAELKVQSGAHVMAGGSRNVNVRHTPHGCFIVEFHWPGLFSRADTAEAILVPPQPSAPLPDAEAKGYSKSSAPNSTKEQLHQLKDLFESGLLDENEYKEKRKAILDGI